MEGMLHGDPADLAILYVDDEQPNLKLFRRLFDDTFRVITVASGAEALRVLEAERVGVLVTDQRMPGMTGIELLATASTHYPHTTRMLLTAYSDREILLEAINRGHVHDYVLKVWDVKDLSLRLRNGLDAYQRRAQAARAEVDVKLLGAELAHLRGDGTIVGLRDVVAALPRLAQGDTPILLEGERGSGKELIARELHRLSGRAGAFVPVRCGGRSPADLDAAILGDEDRGLVGHAEGGTLFIDEIGWLPAELLERLAGSPLRVRLVAATRFPAGGLPFEGRRLTIPPLRERPEDLEPLASHFLDALSQDLGRRLRLGAVALAALRNHSFPGNARELRLVLERCALVEPQDELECRHLAAEGSTHAAMVGHPRGSAA